MRVSDLENPDDRIERMRQVARDRWSPEGRAKAAAKRAQSRLEQPESVAATTPAPPPTTPQGDPPASRTEPVGEQVAAPAVVVLPTCDREHVAQPVVVLPIRESDRLDQAWRANLVPVAEAAKLAGVPEAVLLGWVRAQGEPILTPAPDRVPHLHRLTVEAYLDTRDPARRARLEREATERALALQQRDRQARMDGQPETAGDTFERGGDGRRTPSAFERRMDTGDIGDVSVRDAEFL